MHLSDTHLQVNWDVPELFLLVFIFSIHIWKTLGNLQSSFLLIAKKLVFNFFTLRNHNLPKNPVRAQ